MCCQGFAYKWQAHPCLGTGRRDWYQTIPETTLTENSHLAVAASPRSSCKARYLLPLPASYENKWETFSSRSLRSARHDTFISSITRPWEKDGVIYMSDVICRSTVPSHKTSTNTDICEHVHTHTHSHSLTQYCAHIAHTHTVYTQLKPFKLILCSVV